jgi:hypothetical protein
MGQTEFFGSATALIQSLNAQFEALMSEMFEIKRRAGETNANGKTARVSPSLLQNGDSNDDGYRSEVRSTNPKRKDFDVTESGNKNGVSTAKCPRHEEAHDAWLGIDSILSISPTIHALLSMLDPRSLIRCAEVLKPWAAIHKDDQVWLDRSADRFGY